ncbi:DMT family transporter [Roseibium polysiphoniae]|uniref:DMT family transporter n=1 Tax=Roseibium polysiphoniae TaxID=2571221 RepID=A0ABR9CAE8_9HYPH|nr:DMT family transporter [Roseibium polysiphoniae]MBD8876882.1 DMT family transporter [Roseibium polysiphoniae]
MTLANWFLLLLLGTIWGGSFLFAKVAVAEIPPLVLVFLRVLIAGLALHFVLRLRGISFPLSPTLLVSFLVMGLLNNAVPFSLLFWGQTEISAGLASILNATTPIFTFVIAAVLLQQETVQFHRAAGVVLGIAGVAIMLLPNLTGAGHDPLWAQLACLGAALSYGLAAAYARRFKDLPPVISATGQLTGSSLIMLPIAVLSSGSWTMTSVSFEVWANVLALGLVATAAAYLIYFRLLADAGATNASLVTLIVPATAILFGVIILGESLTGFQIGGLGLLLLGLLVLDGRIILRRLGLT